MAEIDTLDANFTKKSQNRELYYPKQEILKKKAFDSGVPNASLMICVNRLKSQHLPNRIVIVAHFMRLIKISICAMEIKTL